MQRKSDDDWVKQCMNFVVTGPTSRGRPRKTWTEVVEGDLRTLELEKDDALDKKKWRRLIHCVDSDSWDSESDRSSGNGSPGVTPGLYPIGGYVP